MFTGEGHCASAFKFQNEPSPCSIYRTNVQKSVEMDFWRSEKNFFILKNEVIFSYCMHRGIFSIKCLICIIFVVTVT